MLNGFIELVVVLIDSVLVMSVVWYRFLIVNMLLSVSVVDVCVLFRSVRFFFVCSVSGVRFVMCRLLSVFVCLLWMNILLMFSSMVDMCVSGVRLFDVLIEFFIGISGSMLVLNSVISVFIIL